jgi:hypothetical protein
MTPSVCSVDHSTLEGKLFCTVCGEKVTPKIHECANGHEMASKLKFCTECGLPPAGSVSAPAPMPIPTRVPNIRLPVDEISLSTPVIGEPAFNPTQGTTTSNNTGINSPIVRGIAIAVGAVLVAIFVFVAFRGSVATTDVTVKMVLVGENCSSVSWGYSDIPGGTVNLSVDGVSVGSGSYTSYGTTVVNGCQFTATIPAVKENGSNYTISTGNILRGSVTNSKADLSGNNWTFELTLGGN